MQDKSYVPFNKILMKKIFFIVVVLFLSQLFKKNINRNYVTFSQQDKIVGAITAQGRYSKQITRFVIQDFLRLWRIKSVVCGWYSDRS